MGVNIPNEAKINIAVIGASRIAQAHAMFVKQNASACLKYVVSRDKARAELFARKFKVIAADSLEAVLNDKEVSAVIVATEPARHADVAVAAIQAGKHVLIEKPLAQDVATARRILLAKQNAQVTAGVVSQWRFDSRILALKEILAAGDLGELLTIDVQLGMSRPEEYYRSGNGWRMHSSGGVVLNQAIHAIDVLLWLLGMPKHIRALMAGPDSNDLPEDRAVVSMVFSGGVLASIMVTTALPKGEGASMTLRGKRGTLHIAPPFWGESNWPLFVLHALKLQKHPFAGQIDDFIGAIQEGRQPLVTIEDGMRALEVAEAARISSGWQKN